MNHGLWTLSFTDGPDGNDRGVLRVERALGTPTGSLRRLTGDLFLAGRYAGDLQSRSIGAQNGRLVFELDRADGATNERWRLEVGASAIDYIWDGTLGPIGQPGRPVRLVRQDWALRRLSLDIRRLENAAPLSGLMNSPVLHDGGSQSLGRAFLDAWVRVTEAPQGQPLPFARPEIGLAELHAVMTANASTLDSWNGFVLAAPALSRAPKAWGVMFDTGGHDVDDRPRMGCAVFTSAFTRDKKAAPVLMLRTLCHEIGHMLNLAHPASRPPDGDFLMEETQKVLARVGGVNNVRFFFSVKDLGHLRHAAFPRIALGGDGAGEPAFDWSGRAHAPAGLTLLLQAPGRVTLDSPLRLTRI